MLVPYQPRSQPPIGRSAKPSPLSRTLSAALALHYYPLRALARPTLWSPLSSSFSLDPTQGCSPHLLVHSPSLTLFSVLDPSQHAFRQPPHRSMTIDLPCKPSQYVLPKPDLAPLLDSHHCTPIEPIPPGPHSCIEALAAGFTLFLCLFLFSEAGNTVPQLF